MNDHTIPLRKQYPTAYNSWRNMKRRVKEDGGTVHPDFEDFNSFLDAMGLPPSDKHTLDRIDNSLNEYSPENCRWASKREQSANRRNTIFLEVDGVKQSLSDWAEDTSQKPNTLRSRYHKGWTDREVVYGKRSSGGGARKGANHSSTKLPQQEINKFKGHSVHNCHVSLKWPWMDEKGAEDFETRYLELSGYPETRYEFFDRYSLERLRTLKARISDFSAYKVWLMAPNNFEKDQRKRMQVIKEQYGISDSNLDQLAIVQLDKKRKVEDDRSRMLNYKMIAGPFHQKSFPPR